MNKNLVNKSSTNLHQKPIKSIKKPHTNNKSKENKNRIPQKNKFKQINKPEILNNNTNINNNIRPKSQKKNNSNKVKNKPNINIANINIIPNSEKILNTISTSNIHQQKIKPESNNKENICDNIPQKKINVSSMSTSNNLIYHTNKNHIRIKPIYKSNINNKNMAQFNINNSIKNNNKFHSDLNDPNFLCQKKPKYQAKTDLKKITNRFNIKNGEITIPNFENLKFISLEDTNDLFTAWQNCSMIYKIFEEKIMKKNNFEINKNTLELITKNAEASEQLNDQKFWILYIEYLINNNLLLNEKQFLSVINEAFTYIPSNNCTQLRIYYLQKIKKYSPVYLKDGTFDDSDETYINKLNQSTINFIKKQKGVISSNVKLKSANKTKIFKLENNSQNKEIMKNNKINCIAKIGGNI